MAADPPRRGSLRDVGEDPDPRFTFSNERTLLSWIRTGLALAAAGVVLDSLVQDFGPRLRTGLSAALLCAAAVSSVGGYLRWMNSERALRTRSRRRMHRVERFADFIFIVGLILMAATCGFIVYAIALFS